MVSPLRFELSENYVSLRIKSKIALNMTKFFKDYLYGESFKKFYQFLLEQR